jgi:outer membrane lipoprotein-sorting protein
MNHKIRLAIAASFLILVGCSSSKTAGEIVAESVRAHGGTALTDWKTMVVRGESYQKDGRLWFRGEYIVYAQKPDKIRMETDLTKFERGRFFYSEILNGDRGWMVRNLLPVYRDEFADRFKAKLDRCDGIGFYAANADSLTLVREDEIEGQAVYVIEATLGERTATLTIDRESFLLLKEEVGNVTLVYSEFKELGGALRASKIHEVTAGNRTVEITYTYNSVEVDVEIDPILFEEEMPTS